MISAFGVDHGEVSKAYAKVKHKIWGAPLYKDAKTKKHNTMNSKLRQHAVGARLVAGGHGGQIRALKNKGMADDHPYMVRSMKRAKEHAAGAKGMYAAISRDNRKTRTLP